MTWNLSSNRERARAERPRNLWLEREEIILRHLKAMAGLFRWLYRCIGVSLFLSAAAILVVALFSRNLGLLALAVAQLPIARRLYRHVPKREHESEFEEMEAAIETMRRGNGRLPEYSQETQSLRKPYMGDVAGQMAVVAVVLFFCAALCIGMAVFFMGFLLIGDGPGALFWGFSPAYLFLLFIGVPLGVLGVVYLRSAWGLRKL